MHSNNISLASQLLKLAGTRRIDVVGIWDSNGTFGGYGWDHGIMQAMITRGYQMYATPLYSLGEGAATDGTNAAQGNGHGIYGGSDANRISHRSNSSLTTAMNTATCLRMQATVPHADLIKHWDMRSAGNYAPCNYVYAPTGTAWNASQAVGIAIYGGANNPLDATGELRADLWLGEFPSGTTGSVQYRWIDNGAGVGSTGSTNSAGAGAGYAMRKVSHTLASGARAGTVEFRCPMGGGGQWFGTFCRAVNTGRTKGCSVSGLYSCGSQSTYDMANALIGMPNDSLQHYLDCVTDSQTGTKKALVWVAIGPNDTSETNKLAGAPAGLGSDAAVVKYNVEQIVSRIVTAWEGMGRNKTDLVVLLTTHPPQQSGNTSMGPYHEKLVEISDANPTHVVAFDMSLAVTYAELADNTAAPTFSSNGTDVNHLKDADSYHYVASRAINAMFRQLGVTDSPVAKKLGMNVGEAGSMNASPMMEFANAAKMMDRMVQKRWSGWGVSSVGTGANAVVTTDGNHGLTTGDIVEIYGTSTTPTINGATRTVTVLSSTTFHVGINVTSGQASPGGGLFLNPISGQVDANGWYKYKATPTDYIGNDTVLLRKEEVAARNLQSTNWVATWTGTGTLSLTNTVGSPSSSTGRLEFQIAAVDHVAMILTGLPASPGGTGHFKDLWIGPLSEEGSTAIASTPLKQKLAPFAGGALRMMIMNRVAEAGWDPITEQRPLETDAVWANTLKGVPVSVQVKLAKECGMVPWLNVTHKAAGTGDGPDANYANMFVAEVEAACDEGDTVIVEFSNEAWNQTFSAWTYFKGKGNTLFATGNDYEDSQRYYAMKSMQWALACKAAETGKCKFKYVLGAFILDNISNQSVRAQSYAGLYVQDVFDAFAIAAYFGGDFGVSDPGHYGETILDNLALIGQAATIDAMFTQADSMIAAFDDEVADGKAAWASTGLPMWIYEGLSQHPLFDYDPVNMTTNTDFHACFEAYLSDPRIYALTKKIVNAGYKYCDGPACYFNLAGQRPIDLPCVGMFGSMKYASSNPSDDASGAYRAIVDIASGGGGASGGIGPKKITGKFTASKVTSKKVSGI